MKTLQTTRAALPATRVEADAPLRLWELVGIFGLAFFWLWLRSVSVYNHTWDSDETQHLHVVWGWTQGLIPYRDFFDNHTPLFHFLFAPVLNLLGERADVVDLMRWCMVPLVALILWCTYRLGAQVFSERVGIVAALLCAFYPNEYFKVGEFRTDVLWTLFWLSTLVSLTKPRQTRCDQFLAGLTFGAAFATSQKTVMLSLVLLVATVLTYALVRVAGRRQGVHVEPASALPVRAGIFFWAGLVVVPGLLLTFFSLEGAWPQMIYGVVRHNLVKVIGPDRPYVWADLHHLLFWLVLPVAGAAWMTLRHSQRRDRAERQAWLLMVAGSYCTILLGIWTVLSAQDYLPYHPIWLVVVVAGLFWLGRGIAQRLPGCPWIFPLLLVVVFTVEIGWLVREIRFSDRRNRFRIEQIREVLALTRPGEPVLDAKGGSVYRPRAIPYVMETLTRLRMREGLLANDIAERLVANRIAVAINLSWFPKATKDFVDKNYLYTGLVHVAGKQVYPEPAGVVPFRLEIPNRYVFVDAWGLVPGRLDGGQPADRFEMTSGNHSFAPDRELTGACYVLVESAYDAGFTPFNKELKLLEARRKTAD